MSRLPSAFNMDEVGEMDVFEPVPAGVYDVEIIKAPDKNRNSKDTGYVYKLHFKIISGDCTGRLIFVNLNLEHDNADTELRARKEYKAICVATGRMVNDTEELVGGQLSAKVAVRAATTQYAASNDIKKYMPLEGAAIPSLAKSSPAGSASSSAAPRSKKVQFNH